MPMQKALQDRENINNLLAEKNLKDLPSSCSPLKKLLDRLFQISQISEISLKNPKELEKLNDLMSQKKKLAQEARDELRGLQSKLSQKAQQQFEEARKALKDQKSDLLDPQDALLAQKNLQTREHILDLQYLLVQHAQNDLEDLKDENRMLIQNSRRSQKDLNALKMLIEKEDLKNHLSSCNALKDLLDELHKLNPIYKLKQPYEILKKPEILETLKSVVAVKNELAKKARNELMELQDRLSQEAQKKDEEGGSLSTVEGSSPPQSDSQEPKSDIQHSSVKMDLENQKGSFSNLNSLIDYLFQISQTELPPRKNEIFQEAQEDIQNCVLKDKKKS
ncbi:hypothetical protein DI09_3p70 [Mitosporidium daphniae]|uniref:Uncharacterized protein n=1 Tax=Mitosporidium daphniae TaxID=1485682 RepID=A0A098VQJ8_9MICR|nr:uncharacterized protein DI09_3p70 [Mitosporidium daphniae]KGG51245.1 hypothetical protein DI09_3p70 [Mitosporidium daphniae]|eukprot:XP_013237740.1 uncharacterized protein DI09_3p70 [Mitosporidium daphniae]